MLDRHAAAKWMIERAERKDGYIMCSVGQNPKKLNEWYFDQYKNDRERYNKALYWREHAERVFDCQGLMDGYITEMTGEKTNVKARDNYTDWCGIKGKGTVPAEYRMEMTHVFYYNGDYISHVGYLVKPIDPEKPKGDWWVCEARGVMYGVVLTKLSARNWNRWGLCTKYFDYGEDTVDTPLKLTLGSRILKRGMSGDDVRELQERLNFIHIDCGGADGVFGMSTQNAVTRFQGMISDLDIDGIYGPMTHAALMDYYQSEITQDQPEAQPKRRTITINAGSWYVRSGAGTQHTALTVVHGGDKYPMTAKAENNWAYIDAGGIEGWISPKGYIIDEEE